MKIEDYKISIVIPTFNRIGSLPRALDSALNQTYQPSEIIVVDNGSSDGTTKLLRERYPSIRLLIEKKLGVSAARNKGIRHSKFQWIALLDSDDAWDKTKLEKQKNALASSQDQFRLVHTDEIWIRNGNKFNQMKKHQKFGGDIFNNCLSLCCISPSSVLINKNIFKEVGYFDESLPVCEDYDLWLKICSQEKILFINQKLTLKYGGHKDQLSKTYWGMDRFRIKSLENLILNYKLKPDQKINAIKTIVKKLKIIVNGAYKRNNSSIINKYEEKLFYWKNISTSNLE
ncbi:MAG: glycosyltransferase family 2 protein [Candidatus Puniceispirillales bacterium]|tara:strand:- start:320 stop:1180 length:861 start_codon:yes stop_codon:yes gene_type:complete